MLGEIRNEHGERLDYTYHKGSGNRIVVIGHGVTGNKDRPALIALAEGLAEAGISTLRFSFSGNGESEGEFIDSTITKEVSDLGSVFDALGNYKICYVGHSMGGAVGVLRAAVMNVLKYLSRLLGWYIQTNLHNGNLVMSPLTKGLCGMNQIVHFLRPM